MGGIRNSATIIAMTKKYVMSSCMDQSAFDIVKVDASLHKQSCVLGVSERSEFRLQTVQAPSTTTRAFLAVVVVACAVAHGPQRELLVDVVHDCFNGSHVRSSTLSSYRFVFAFFFQP
jgi:hypothetical protein